MVANKIHGMGPGRIKAQNVTMKYEVDTKYHNRVLIPNTIISLYGKLGTFIAQNLRAPERFNNADRIHLFRGRGVPNGSLAEIKTSNSVHDLAFTEPFNNELCFRKSLETLIGEVKKELTSLNDLYRTVKRTGCSEKRGLQMLYGAEWLLTIDTYVKEMGRTVRTYSDLDSYRNGIGQKQESIFNKMQVVDLVDAVWDCRAQTARLIEDFMKDHEGIRFKFHIT